MKIGALFGCLAGFLMDTPVHVAVGSLAPKNGFALGPAFVTHHPTNENWDISWNADAVRSFNGSWRAGAYVTVVRTAVELPTAVDINAAPADQAVVIHPYPVFDIHVQTTSLQRLLFFGLGADSRGDGRSSFGMSETVIGSRGVWPLPRLGALNMSLAGELNGRLIALRDPSGPDEPAIASRYSEAAAPGLSAQPGYLQFGEGVRVKPSLLNNRLRFNYLVTVQQFIAPSDGTQSFHRWTLDLTHEIPIYRTVMPGPSETNGPDECAAEPGKPRCPVVSRNRYGAVGFRLLSSSSGAGAGHQVPFYFQPTLGGSDIDANRNLSAYDDYRFRGPRLFLLQESIEHSLYSILGVTALVEQGTVGTATSFAFSSMKRSVAVGFTLRAGNLPLAQVLWAWGSEGRRFVAMVSPTLLGGSTRPSLR
jgi:hypothetical protein